MSESIFNPDNSIYAEYFRLTDFFLKKYGSHTILLLQVGAFFEMYATKDSATGVLSRSKIEEMCLACGGLAISEKKYTHGSQQIVMAGFRDYNVDRYIQNAVDSNFTVVVYTQKEFAPGRMTREHSGTFSPGTFLPSDSDTTAKMTNNVMCLWIDKYSPGILSKPFQNRNKIICGAAVVNIFTGQSTLFEYETTFEMVPATFDALERFVCTHSPSETIFVSPFDNEQDSKKILQFTGVSSRTIHLINHSLKCSAVEEEYANQETREIVDRCRQQKYIRHVLSSYFREDTYDICDEFRNYVVGTQAYCYLLHFIQERNPNLVRKIALPQFDNKTTNMILANHTLRQLNIIDDGNSAAEDADMSGSNLRSVSAFLNKCGSAIGRRRFIHQMVHPTFDTEWLNSEYDAIETLLQYPEMITTFRKIVREVADLEKIGRQLVSRKLNPDSVARLYKSVLAIQQIHISLLSQETDLCTYFIRDAANNRNDENGEEEDPNKIVASWITLILEFISVNLIVEKCEGCSSTTSFEDNILRPGVNEELDALLCRMEENEELFQVIRRKFNTIMSKIEVTKNSATTEYIKVHDTEKTGSFLQLTKKRSATLKKHLGELVKKDPNAKIVFSLGSANIPVPVSDIQIPSSGMTNDTISFHLLDKIIREKITIRDTINATISKAYSVFLDRLEIHCLSTIERLVNFIAKVDVLQSKAYAAKMYGYCRPTIDMSGSDAGYVDAKGLRHVLIEHIQTQELYVVNDLCLSKQKKQGQDQDQDQGQEEEYRGMLLYGTNAVGKTSLIRALGIAVVMAQSGMYVPCSTFFYRPYRAIFTRILGNDNLFKNLSMFAVEMSELRVILNAADEYSLVLGDELCSGTETESALSIFVSGLTDLHEKRTTFLFATHFHEILKFDEIKALTKVAVRHMAVHYDRENDCLVYDRVLREGAGNRLYGLEVAKSLHLPDAFIERAYQIRNKYFPDMRGSLSSPQTKYNSAKIRGLCELCKEELGEEIHHLQEQRAADENGRIGSIHKNHSANLMSLCEKCHIKMHLIHPTTNDSKEKPKIIRKKTTKGYIVS
jgi:DNA mismatch repair protein MutS